MRLYPRLNTRIRDLMLIDYAEWQHRWDKINNPREPGEKWDILGDLNTYSADKVKKIHSPFMGPVMVWLPVSVGDEAGVWDLYAFVEINGKDEPTVTHLWHCFDTQPDFIMSREWDNINREWVTQWHHTPTEQGYKEVILGRWDNNA